MNRVRALWWLGLSLMVTTGCDSKRPLETSAHAATSQTSEPVGANPAPSATAGAALSSGDSASCDWSSLSVKSKDAPGLHREWLAAAARDWGANKRPTKDLSVALRRDANASEVAGRFRATIAGLLEPSGNVYLFRFDSTDDAINQIRPLICDPLVQWVAMSLIFDGVDSALDEDGESDKGAASSRP
jgi:hypothetical protein